MVRGTITEYIPNPTFEVVGSPGAQEDDFIEELEFVAERGAKAILVRPAPVPGYQGRRSFALPEFDPFWKRVTELGILTCLHASDDGYGRYANEWEGTTGEVRAFAGVSNFRGAAMGHRAIEDAMASLLGHGCLTRHPDLKVMTVENGSSWVRPLLRHLEQAWSRSRATWPAHPVETFKH